MKNEEHIHGKEDFIVIRTTSFITEEDVDPTSLTPFYFSTPEEWLHAICSDNGPQTDVSFYEFGVFESEAEFTLYLVGKTVTSSNEDDIEISISYRPVHSNYVMPINFYGEQNRDGIINKISERLKDFVRSTTFQSSFLAEAEKIIFSTTGEIIYRRS